MFGFLRKLFGNNLDDSDVQDIAARLDLATEQLLAVEPRYHSFQIPKRRGGHRRIEAPEADLKALQRRLLRRLLARLRAHDAATGFERGRSIVDNARPHVGRRVIIQLDIRDFFESTDARRIEVYFRAIGWNRRASRLLTRLTTHQGHLPQGAPTSPRLANLVNHELDARLAALAAAHSGRYTRYADDLTFSLGHDAPLAYRSLIAGARQIAQDYGYRLHSGRKLQVRRHHQRQQVTGLVVNDRINLPRERRRWLRAVAHHLETGREASLTPAQLAGWQALQRMLESRDDPDLLRDHGQDDTGPAHEHPI